MVGLALPLAGMGLKFDCRANCMYLLCQIVCTMYLQYDQNANSLIVTIIMVHYWVHCSLTS